MGFEGPGGFVKLGRLDRHDNQRANLHGFWNLARRFRGVGIVGASGQKRDADPGRKKKSSGRFHLWWRESDPGSEDSESNPLK